MTKFKVSSMHRHEIINTTLQVLIRILISPKDYFITLFINTAIKGKRKKNEVYS